MIYNLTIKDDRNRFSKRVESLLKNQRLVDLKEITDKTIPQNKYLHLIIRYMADEVGESFDYVKEVYYKAEANYDIFYSPYIDVVLGKEVYQLKSTSSLSKEELSKSIDNFRNWASAECGVYLPSPDEEELLASLMSEASRRGYVHS